MKKHFFYLLSTFLMLDNTFIKSDCDVVMCLLAQELKAIMDTSTDLKESDPTGFLFKKLYDRMNYDSWLFL